MQISEHPVAVVGGGIIGLSCAIGLAQRNIKVLLYAEPPAADTDRMSYDTRSYSLSQASLRLLDALGVMSLITRYSNFEALEVWDRGGGRIHFDASEVGAARLGIVVEHKYLIDALWQRIKQMNNISCYNTHIASANTVRNGTVEIQSADGKQQQLSLLIGADGVHSQIRKLMNTRWSLRDYRQTAFAYVVETTKDHYLTGWQQFSDKGVLAFLPLAHRVCAVIWSCPNSSAQCIAEMDIKDLVALSAAEIAYRLGTLSPLSSLSSFRLYGGFAKRYVAAGMMLIGDAAHNIHPMAGQGANLGFADLNVLLNLLHHSRYGRMNYPLLRRYERTVKGRNLCMKTGLEGLLWLFSNQSPLCVYSRAGGLRLIDNTPILKHFFIRQAGGI